MNFTFVFEPLPALLLCLALLTVLLIWFLYLRRIGRVSALASRQAGDFSDIDPEVAAVGLEPASVVVYAQDEAENVARLLPQILGQVYSPGFEVIVVNEGASEATADVVNALALKHHNLYITFTPDGARNLSRKKLGLMLGIKAARSRVVVNTTAAAVIDSPYWLLAMMRNFSDAQTQVVLGYASPASADKGHGRRCRAFDFVAASVTWLTSAIAGKPYRGTEFNIAYTREAFFANKGFSSSLNLRYGDDDIFVSEIANGANTAVELSPESHVGIRMHNHRGVLNELACRHEFTGRYVSKSSRRLMALGSWLLWVCTGCAATAALLALPNLVYAAVALAIVIGEFIWVSAAWRRALKALGGRRLLLTLPCLALGYPVRNALRTLRCRLRKGRNYTWN